MLTDRWAAETLNSTDGYAGGEVTLPTARGRCACRPGRTRAFLPTPLEELASLATVNRWASSLLAIGPSRWR
jgi:hypothetical protein